ncbi:MAG TPA: hypothetical protein VK530_06570 [Candidatus Acidoferrum sp.]|nr:hypothetical protein [Candidatus Acidoferrum sp.]
MAKAEISWKREDESGESVQVYAHHVGDRWIFYKRSKRFDDWEEQDEPPLEDWMELLDAVRRRIARRLVRPEEEGNVRRSLLQRFPDAKV